MTCLFNCFPFTNNKWQLFWNIEIDACELFWYFRNLNRWRFVVTFFFFGGGGGQQNVLYGNVMCILCIIHAVVVYFDGRHVTCADHSRLWLSAFRHVTCADHSRLWLHFSAWWRIPFTKHSSGSSTSMGGGGPQELFFWKASEASIYRLGPGPALGPWKL